VVLVLAVVAWSPAPVQAVRETLFDAYQRLVPRERRSAPVTIVEIDETALAEQGQWPWPRTLVAELVSRIAEHQPAAIGFDLLFAEPDRFSPAEVSRLVPLPEDLAKSLQRLPSNDTRLADAIRGRNVVLAIAGLDERPAEGSPPLRQYGRQLASVPEIDRAAAGRGLISVDMPERMVRRVPLVARVGDTPVPALALELWRVGTGARHFALSDAGAGLLRVEFADAAVPVQRDGTMWLRYSRHDQTRFVSAAQVLAGNVNPQLIRAKLVLIGVTGVGLLDYKATPLGEQVPGVELHAQLIEQIFDGAYLVRPAWSLWLELALLAGGAAILIALVPSARVHFSVAAVLGLLIAFFAAGIWAFAQGVLVDAAWPALGLGAAFAVLLAATLSEADRQRRELREAAALAAGELAAARRIQMGLLPDTSLFDAEPSFALRALVHPARTVGGDFYDCFKLDDKRLFFAVADVSGKGMPAALFMALCKATIKAAVMSAGAEPATALRRAAQEIARDNAESFFVTVFAGTLELETGELVYCNAGHEPPYVRGSGGVHRLPIALRPPVGVPGAFAFTAESLRLAPGDALCALTDGVTEAMNERGELYGAQRLERLLGSLPPQASPSQINAAVIEDVKRFVGEAAASDDLTLLALRWN
jgi:CHASE2 domain-containing sensor protein/serine phosphatase RsbU (regulator of sigma subunit)